MLMANELGADIEDAYERELKAAHQLEGAVEALKQAALKVPHDLAERVDQEMNEGESFKEGMSKLQVAELVKKYLGRAGVYLAHMAQNESKKVTEQLWRAQGLKDAMALVSKTREAESQKLQEALALVESGEGGPRPTASPDAARAAHGTAAERRAAAKAAKEKPAKTPRKKAAKKAARKKANG